MAAMASKFNFECVIQYYTDQWCATVLLPLFCHLLFTWAFNLIIAAERQRGSTLFLTLHEVLAFSCSVSGRVIYCRYISIVAVEMSANPGEN